MNYFVKLHEQINNTIFWQNITVWKPEFIFLTVYESKSWDAYSIDLTSDASKTHADPIFYTRCCQMLPNANQFGGFSIHREHPERWHSWSFIARKNRRSFHFHRRYENARGVIHKVLFFSKKDNSWDIFIRANIWDCQILSTFMLVKRKARGNIHKCFFL